jgi:hypothetical protein
MSIRLRQLPWDMLCIPRDASSGETVQFARNRKGKILARDEIINGCPTDGRLTLKMREEFSSKVKYPIKRKIQRYLSLDFKAKIGDGQWRWLKSLVDLHHMDCELIEYDTVINRMTIEPPPQHRDR